MNKLYKLFGIEWERPLKWYEHLLYVWVGFSFCGLAIDLDTIPMWAVVLIVGNLCASIWVSSKVLPDIKEFDDYFSNEKGENKNEA